jgi:hypothetical protein
MKFRVGAYLWLAFDKDENESNNPRGHAVQIIDVLAFMYSDEL